MSMLEYSFMQRAFLTGILLAVITPLIGMTIVLKRMSMIGDALSHASLAGVALGLILEINPVVGGMCVCVTAALTMEGIQKITTVCRNVYSNCYVSWYWIGRSSLWCRGERGEFK